MTKPRWTGTKPFNISTPVLTYCEQLVDYASEEVQAGRWIKGTATDGKGNHCLSSMLNGELPVAQIVLTSLIIGALDKMGTEKKSVVSFNDDKDTTAEDALLLLKHVRGSLEAMREQSYGPGA